ncbi:hypothetical protein RIF29_32637 [Crotalaria pallida]|uniref:Uncharacterized protein n=1 Tax=Crotalaria pallida TaxID=3830 RepID=A0AAN9EIE9_CROPI
MSVSYLRCIACAPDTAGLNNHLTLQYASFTEARLIRSVVVVGLQRLNQTANLTPPLSFPFLSFTLLISHFVTPPQHSHSSLLTTPLHQIPPFSLFLS